MKSEENKILITYEQLQEYFDESRNQVEELLDSSRILYQQNKFSTSIALSILAREEFAKLTMIQMHINYKKGIFEKDWESLKTGYGVHDNKLKGPIKNAKKTILDQGKDLYKLAQENSEPLGYSTQRF